MVHRNISDANSLQAVEFLLTIPVISSELDQFSQKKKLWQTDGYCEQLFQEFRNTNVKGMRSDIKFSNIYPLSNPVPGIVSQPASNNVTFQVTEATKQIYKQTTFVFLFVYRPPSLPSTIVFLAFC